MFLTLEDIKILSQQINGACKNGLIQKISLILPSGLQLTVRAKKSTKRIILFDSPRFPAIVVSKRGWEFLSEWNPQFLQILKKHIKGKTIINIDQLSNDRIVSISFEECSLIIECIERFANIILLDSSNKISTSHVPLRTPLRYHEAYSLPPALEKSSAKTIEDVLNPSEEVLSRIKDQIQQQGQSDALKRLNKELKKKRELIEHLNSDLEESRNCERFKKEGDLLKRVVSTIPLGTKSVDVVDYESYPPRNVSIKINPNVHPAKYVENLFNKYKKLKRAEAGILSRIAILKTEIERLLIKKGKIESEELIPAVEFQEKQKRKKREEASGPRVFHSSDDFKIFVARNVEQGEKLVRQAKSNDMWLHVLNSPGPHVIIQRIGRKPIPHRTMVEAAVLAVYFSPIRRQGKGDVTVAERRYIKFVKGIAGKVTYSRSETISVKIDEEKLKPFLSPP
ncbi:MAG: hypothetical protein A3F16_07270 [Deltaproteobacteria bacterium RIFCSPHIGHO2_12_FULL_43_9]|nr:MAG: hypothetical protein A3F16_07270 [Deltaproteobacteria bacterium RIFCSPHIGHO2_12_FULL_43_9]